MTPELSPRDQAEPDDPIGRLRLQSRGLPRQPSHLQFKNKEIVRER